MSVGSTAEVTCLPFLSPRPGFASQTSAEIQQPLPKCRAHGADRTGADAKRSQRDSLDRLLNLGFIELQAHSAEPRSHYFVIIRPWLLKNFAHPPNPCAALHFWPPDLALPYSQPHTRLLLSPCFAGFTSCCHGAIVWSAELIEARLF